MTEINEQSVTDLLSVCGKARTWDDTYHFLLHLTQTGTVLGQLDSTEGEAACIVAMEKHKFSACETREAIQELCNHRSELRMPLARAAEEQARTMARAETKIGQLENRFAATITAIDPRTKAILRAVAEIIHADWNVDSEFYSRLLREMGDQPLDLLRSDQVGAELLALRDMAELLIETAR